MQISVTKKNRKYTITAWVLALLVLAVAIPLNLIFDRLNIYVDMTPNSMYTLTDTTENYLDELDAQGIVVDVYFLQEMENLENELEMLPLYRTLLAYDKHECFNLIDFDPDTNPQQLKELNPDGVLNLSENDFLFKYGDMVKRLPATLTFTYYVTTNENGESVTQSAELRAENYMTGYVKSVVDGVVPVVYFLEGHGEVPMENLTRLSANLGNYNYGAEPLNLINAEAVPEDACILVIAGPTRDITDEEYEKILDFTEKGGNVSLLMTPNSAELAYTNLERLMTGFCIGMDYDRISETDTARHKSGDPYTFMCDLVPAAPEAEDDLTDELLQANDLVTYMPASRSFYSIYGSNYTTCAIDTLMETQSSAHAEPYGGTIADPDPVDGQELALAMYSKDSMRNDAKLVVFGSAEFITDTGVSNEYFIVPLQMFLSTITWMYNSDVDMNIANKEKTYDSLNVNSESAAKGYIALFVAAPLAVAAAGLIVWLRRKDA